MERAQIGAAVLVAFAAAFLTVGVVVGGDSEPSAAVADVRVRLTPVAAIPAMADDPAAERAQRARRAARRAGALKARRRAAALEAARLAARSAPAPADAPVAPTPGDAPEPEPLVPPTPPAPTPLAPAPTPTPPATPPPTFDDEG